MQSGSAKNHWSGLVNRSFSHEEVPITCLSDQETEEIQGSASSQKLSPLSSYTGEPKQPPSPSNGQAARPGKTHQIQNSRGRWWNHVIGLLCDRTCGGYFCSRSHRYTAQEPATTLPWLIFPFLLRELITDFWHTSLFHTCGQNRFSITTAFTSIPWSWGTE